MIIWEEKTKNHYNDGGLDIGSNYCAFQKFYQWLQVSLPSILNEKNKTKQNYTKWIKIYLQGQVTYRCDLLIAALKHGIWNLEMETEMEMETEYGIKFQR